MNNKNNDKDFILSELLRLLGERYEIGLYEFLYFRYHDVYMKIREIEDEITDGFDTLSIKELKDILAIYWRLHIASIRKYKSEKQLNFDVNEIKKQINSELNVT